MKKFTIVGLLCFFLLLTCTPIFAQEEEPADTLLIKKGDITVKVLGFENDKGKARLLLFTPEEKKHFPSEQKNAMIKRILPIKDNKVMFNLQDLPYGDYAISVHHDENDDDKVNSNWIGIPKEGLGASNDAKGSFGPPSFDKAKITINKPEMSITINMVN